MSGILTLRAFQVRLQTQTIDGGVGAYAGIRDCFTKTVTAEGVASLFRGLSPPLVSVSAQNSILFASYGGTRRLLEARRSADAALNTSVRLTDVYMAGAAAGIACSIVTVPTELIKCRLQCIDQWGSVKATVRDIARHSGLAGLYRGYAVTVLRDAPSYGLYFWSYEATRGALARRIRVSPDDWGVILLAGGVAGSLSWSAIYPLDVIKSRVQAHPNRYAGMVDCYRRSVASDGYAVLVRGLGATVMRAFPVNAVTFLMYELTMHLLRET